MRKKSELNGLRLSSAAPPGSGGTRAASEDSDITAVPKPAVPALWPQPKLRGGVRKETEAVYECRATIC